MTVSVGGVGVCKKVAYTKYSERVYAWRGDGGGGGDVVV